MCPRIPSLRRKKINIINYNYFKIWKSNVLCSIWKKKTRVVIPAVLIVLVSMLITIKIKWLRQIFYNGGPSLTIWSWTGKSSPIIKLLLNPIPYYVLNLTIGQYKPKRKRRYFQYKPISILFSIPTKHTKQRKTTLEKLNHYLK